MLHRLRDHGNTVVVIEHNLDVIKTADWIIDLGPEGGAGGGKIIAQGPPEHVAGIAESYTGRYLKPALNRRAGKRAPVAGVLRARNGREKSSRSTFSVSKARAARKERSIVVPAKAGIQWRSYQRRWIPAFAGMTKIGCRRPWSSRT